MAAIYRRGRVWWIRYSHKGKQYQETLCTRNVRVARRKLDEYEEALKAELFQPAPKLFLEIFLPAFYRYAEKTYPKKSVQNLKSCLGLFFDSAPVHRLDQVTKPMLTEHLQAQSAKRNWNPKTWNNHRSAFVTLFKYAIEYYDFRSPDPGRGERGAEALPQVNNRT